MANDLFRMTPTRTFSASASASTEVTRESRQLTPSPLRLARTCPFAASCSCVFAGDLPAQADHLTGDTGIDEATIKDLTEWGWTIASAGDGEIVLERTRRIPFCFNISLVVLTAGVWAIYWAVRNRRPRTERKVLVVERDGQLAEAA